MRTNWAMWVKFEQILGGGRCINLWTMTPRPLRVKAPPGKVSVPEADIGYHDTDNT